QEQWTDAFTSLADVIDKSGDALVAAGPGRFLNAEDYGRRLIALLPEAGLAAYRQQIDGWAERQYQIAVTTHSEQALELLLQEAYSSSFGDDALWTLGEWHWERGDTQSARMCWKQLIADEIGEADSAPSVRKSPDGRFRRADVQARLVLCSIVEHSRRRARRELESFALQHPDAEGFLAGQSGSLSEILAGLLAQSRGWTVIPVAADWTTFARNSRRNAAAGASVLLEGPQWTMPLAPLDVPNWERSRPALPETAPLGRYPVAADGGLFFHDGVRIRAIRLVDGQPRWPVGGEPDVGDIYPPFHALPIRPVLRPTAGVPRFTATLHQGKLYALTGPSVLTLPDAGLRASPTRLVCLDVGEGEGLLKSFPTAEELFPAGWSMTGTPVASSERLFLPLLRTDPQLEPAVACLAAADGSVLWRRSLGQALTEPLRGRVELGHQLLSVCDDRVCFSTDLGVIAALDARTGVVRWAVTYASTPLEPLARSEEGASGLLPVLCHEGRLFAKPNDSGELMAFDLASGTILWKLQLPGHVVHLLGVRETDLIASGDRLWAIDVETGNVRWRFGSDDPAGFGYGRGTVCGENIFWTTREDLYVIDRWTGQATQRYPLQELLGVSGGHVIAVQDRLIITGRDHITAFGLAPIARSEME
ncbi:MAG: PQQ-binding-like beta-propeller repeat protein, partial [Planctomycetaceae bacterium]